jgi:hypothetical protein
MTIHGVFLRIVRNEAIKIDPPQVYNWRVIALTASVRVLFLITTVNLG